MVPASRARETFRPSACRQILLARLAGGTGAEIGVAWLETVPDPCPYTTHGGLLKQPDKHETPWGDHARVLRPARLGGGPEEERALS